MKYKIDCSCCGKEMVDSDTVLEALAENRIVSIKPVEAQLDPSNAGNFIVTEMCDEWFGGILTPDQLRALGHELIALADTSNPQVSGSRTASQKGIKS